MPPFEHGELLAQGENLRAEIVTATKEGAQVAQDCEGKLDHASYHLWYTVIVSEEPGKRVPAIFFRTEGGGEPVRDWLKMTLSAEDRKRVGHDIMTVEYGWPLGMPACRHLEGRVHEVRTNLSQNRIAGAAMKKRGGKKIAFDHSGSSFDDFLEEEGIREEVEAVAIKRVLAWQLSQEMQQQKKTKQAMARDLQTSRSQLDRLLDPRNVSVSLDTMARAARVLGKSLVIRIRDRKPGGVKHRGAASRPKEQPAKRTHRHGAEIQV